MHNIIKDMTQNCQDLTLLYVEDEQQLAEATFQMLEPFFEKIVLCHDGKEGLEAYENSPFDIVLSDIIMPKLNGKEMSKEIKKINPSQIIIIMSAHEDSEHLMTLIDIGIHKFVTKPTEMNKLFSILIESAININNAKKVAHLAQKTEESLAESQIMLRTIIDTVPVRIFWKDIESRYLGANKLFAQDAGYEDASEIIGKNDFDLIWKDEAQAYIDDDQNVIKSGKEKLSYEEVQTQKDGSLRWLNTSKTVLLDANHHTMGVLGTYNDITEQKNNIEAIKKAKESLGYLAEHDELTDLPNRILFFDRLHQAIKNADRLDKKVGVIFIDLDRFKDINDSFGHDTGDHIIKLFGERLRKQLRKIDTIARFGGDEFIILIESVNEQVDILEVMQKLMASMKATFHVDDKIFYLTISAGISIYPDHGDKEELLIRNADTAMYRAKKEGRNTFHFYNQEMTISSLHHITMAKNIQQAIKNNEFVLYYQPQVDGRRGTLIGMEALIRWKSPDMGFVSPVDFIPIAEDVGLIAEIGKFVFKEASTQIARWYAQGYHPGRMAINLSALELQQPDFVDSLEKRLESAQCQRDWIELEITEGYTMKHPQEAINTLNEITKLGIKLSIDDFGTGYSSLAYLKKLPIYKLKIDQAFVKDLPSNSHDIAIVKTIISLAQTMQFEVIAEGVETQDQHDFLIQNGCHNIQGYYYAKPMPAKDMELFLQGFSQGV